jgi:hypothetical protein
LQGLIPSLKFWECHDVLICPKRFYWIMMVFQAVMLWSFIGRNQTRSVSYPATLFLILKLFLKFVIVTLLINFSILRRNLSAASN